VPDDFDIGIVVPVVTDRLGNLCVSDKYRPVTLSPFVSKNYEYCVLHKFEEVFESLQFGFKKNFSCSYALFVLSQVTDYTGRSPGHAVGCGHSKIARVREYNCIVCAWPCLLVCSF